MKTLVSVKKISNSKILSKSREIIGSFSKGVSKFLPQKKDDSSLIHTAETADFSDDDCEIEELKQELKEQIDHNFNQVTPKVEIKPQLEMLRLSNVKDIYSVPSNNLNETIIEINKTLQKLNLEQERLRQLLEKAKERQQIVDYGKKIILKIISGEDYNSNINRFEAKLRKAENIHASIKDFLIESQKQIENAPLDKRCAAVFEFSHDERLLKYIKALYGFKCQICGFTFEQESGEFYAETYYLEALSDDGVENLDNIIVLCPNHHKMFEYANVSILNAKKEEISVEINGKQHLIKRIPLL
ncbi:MAG: hypothetical protein ACE5NG_07700 [bacterium]